ncbi:unnamed protein product [Arctogadus glacialis]
MSAAGEFPSFFKTLGQDSPRARQKFCGMFCPVEGSADSKTLDLDSGASGRGTPGTFGRVIDRQTDISQPRKVEIHECKGKEALQNLDKKSIDIKLETFRLIFAHPTPPPLHPNIGYFHPANGSSNRTTPSH